MKLAVNNIEEITLILTRKCNLKCSFCNVIYNNKYNAELNCDTIMSKYAPIHSIITRTTKSHINLVLMGGELFSDDINDDVIQSYKTLLVQTEQLCTQCCKTLSVSLMSNLITKRIGRIIDVAKAVKHCDVHGSFDFVGRFDNPKMIALWWENAHTIKQSGVSFFVAMVGHKFNIETILKHDPTWIKLYNEFGVYVQYYEPNSLANNYNLPYEQYRDFLLFLYKEYPEEKFLQSVITAYDKGYKMCYQSNWVDNSGCHKCCNHDIVIKQYKIKHHCFLCPHYHKCPVVCPRVYSVADCCVFKPLFDVAFA